MSKLCNGVYSGLLQLSLVDCRDALEMICNLEAEGDERGAFTLCSGFLTRQLLQEDSYCAWSVPDDMCLNMCFSLFNIY